ncbi:alpha-xenorhabdolysin family binary toxin subunit A [Pseudomonas huanghezhanensis]|uniref:alpha-xenorhabdolysin family binary toxin subunit A n=1 Tax=Pseudomonas huanghezhanensis TaxID=3002903 RepID=UPI0022866785|nr:alpha-xenorhabdolysin family binary toxin subunit A [Pseudomonas sp. BSw22131]
MNASGAMDDAPVRDEKLDLAERLPGTLISAAAGTAEEAIRAPGLILTEAQLIDLMRYTTHGLALPTTLKDVVWYLGYETGAGLNLEARDFQESFNRIHLHAMQWNPLRTDLMNVGSELWVFADQMQVYGNGVTQLYDEIKSKAAKTLDPADHQDFLHYIEQVAALVLERRSTTEALKGRLHAFAQELSTTVMPDVQLKLRSIDTNNVSTEIRTLNDAINRRAAEIEEKQREYKTLIKKSVGAGSILIYLGIYHDVEADKVRKKITALRQEQENSIGLLEQKNRIHASLQRVRHDLHDLSLVILDADIATQNMVVVWNGLHIYLTHSIQEASKIDSALSLRRLMNAFNLVAEPWVQIKRDADTLLKVFKEADREFRKNYGLP